MANVEFDRFQCTPPKGTIVRTVTIDGAEYQVLIPARSDGTLASVTDPLPVTSVITSIAAGDNNIGNVDLASSIPAGDNNIGNVDLASSIPSGDNNIGNVDLASSIPAGTNVIGAARFVDESGVAYGVKHVQNKPRVSSMPYLYDIAEGNVTGHASWTKIGYTPTMTTAESDLWSKAGGYVFPDAAQQMEVVSTDNTQDTATGTGAQKVTIYYLDNLYAEKTEEITLTGTTPADTVATNILRVNGFRVTAAGATGKPLGNLSVRNTAGTVTYAYITAGFTRARGSFYTVPAGKTLYVTTVTFAYGYSTNQTHYARLYTRATQNEGVRTPGIFYPYTEVVCANTSQLVELSIPTKLVEKVDIKVSGISTFAGIATVAMRGWME